MSKTIKNIIYVTIQQVVNTILPFLTIPYIARVLGVEQNGVYSYSLTIATVFAVFFSFGFAIHGANVIAQSTGVTREIRFLEIQILRMLFLFIGIALFFLFVRYYRQGISEVVLILQGTLILVNFFDISWYYQGIGDFKKIVTRNIIVKLVGTVSVFVFVRKPEDLWIYIGLINGSQLLGNIVLFKDILYTVKYINRVEFNKFVVHSKVAFLLFLPNLSGLILSNFDKIFLGSIGDIVGLSNYQQAQRILSFLYTVLMIPSPVIIQKIASLRFTNNHKEANHYVYMGLNMYLALGFFCVFGVVLGAGDFIVIFLGSQYKGAIALFIILSPILITKTVGGVIGGWYLIPLGRNKLHSLPLVIGTIVSVALNIVITPLFGVKAAAIIFVFAEIVVIFIQLLYSKELYQLVDKKNLSVLFLNFLSAYLMTEFFVKMDIAGNFDAIYLNFISVLGIFIGLSCIMLFLTKSSRMFITKCFNMLKGRYIYENSSN
ncbi:oligosaccharide flippase family protein [Priestia aryabhattai]